VNVLDSPRARELQGLGRLAVDTLSDGVKGIETMHRAAAGRAFAGVGPAATPVRVIHDAVAGTVYALVRTAGAAIGTAATSAGLIADARRERPALSASPRGAAVIGALNGILGERLDDGLHVEMGFHPAEPERYGEKLVVFVHGLCETEHAWKLGGRPSYGSLLHDELGYSPLYLRYNTGLTIEENGRRLAALLDQTLAGWPIEVSQIALVGHSMGGLVIRAACHAGGDWCPRVRQVVYLGAPHLGAPLERGAAAAAGAFGRLPETEVFAKVLERRSDGIRDLREGYADAPLLDSADHYCIGATVTRSDRHPMGRAIGDLLVLSPSAGGRGRGGVQKIAFLEDNWRHFGGMNHFSLLSHPQVYEQLRDWLSAGAAPS
jgi:pimeloyl-ACP methyl ester carboxylesterase